MTNKKQLILLIEDNPHIQYINSGALRLRGYEVLCGETIEEGMVLLSENPVNLIVLDVMLPDGNGIDLCRKLRSNCYNLPILFLSALSNNGDILNGLYSGGDDYLAKPYNLEILLARIETLLRRCTPKDPANISTFGLLTLDVLTARGYLAKQDMLLTQKEFAVLYFLCQHQDKSISKEQLYRAVWNQPMESDSQALWSVISRLKKKLSKVPGAPIISTSRMNGYRVEHPFDT